MEGVGAVPQHRDAAEVGRIQPLARPVPVRPRRPAGRLRAGRGLGAPAQPRLRLRQRHDGARGAPVRRVGEHPGLRPRALAGRARPAPARRRRPVRRRRGARGNRRRGRARARSRTRPPFPRRRRARPRRRAVEPGRRRGPRPCAERCRSRRGSRWGSAHRSDRLRAARVDAPRIGGRACRFGRAGGTGIRSAVRRPRVDADRGGDASCNTRSDAGADAGASRGRRGCPARGAARRCRRPLPLGRLRGPRRLRRLRVAVGGRRRLGDPRLAVPAEPRGREVLRRATRERHGRCGRPRGARPAAGADRVRPRASRGRELPRHRRLRSPGCRPRDAPPPTSAAPPRPPRPARPRGPLCPPRPAPPVPPSRSRPSAAATMPTRRLPQRSSRSRRAPAVP